MRNDKANVFDYLEWRGDLTFEQNGFNEIDALILSILAYLDFSCIRENKPLPFEGAVKRINEMPDDIKYDGPGIIMHSVIDLSNNVAKTSRFQDMYVYGFEDITDDEKEIQFAAISFILPDQTVFISFRGTDNTLIGWKEDFNMCFTESIPSQVEAAKYTLKIVQTLEYPLRIGGHSKGGNLAIWAGAHLPDEYKARLIAIYSNDGPGFNESFLQSSIYSGIRNRIYSYVPESSIVGVLMEHDEFITIRSSNPSILQHDPFSWLVLGTKFVYDNKRTISGMQFDRIINSWIKSMSKIEREEFVEDIYDILSSSDAETIEDLSKSKLKSFLSMQKTFREMGFKKQTQLLLSLSKVIFNSDIFENANILDLLLREDNE